MRINRLDPDIVTMCTRTDVPYRHRVATRQFYCSPTCQRTDWQYHRRICKKPEAAVAAPPPAAAKSDAPSPTDKPTSTAPASTDASTSAKSQDNDDVQLDADELAVLAEVKRKGYAHHRRQLDASELAAIGDITPKALSSTVAAPPVTGTVSPAAVAATITPSTATPAPPAVAVSSAVATASAWNTANTYEARNMTGWVRSRLKEIIAEARGSSDLAIPVPGVGRVEVTGISGWGDSSAEVVISRGKPRYVYDLNFAFIATVTPDSEEVTAVTASQVGDEVEVDAEKEKEKAAKAKAEGATAPVTPPAADGATKSKHPRMLLRFPDVRNDTEDDAAGPRGREVRIEWGSPAPPEAQHDLLRRVAAVNERAGLAAACRRVVERVVSEFKSR